MINRQLDAIISKDFENRAQAREDIERCKKISFDDNKRKYNDISSKNEEVHMDLVKT